MNQRCIECGRPDSWIAEPLPVWQNLLLFVWVLGWLLAPQVIFAILFVYRYR